MKRQNGRAAELDEMPYEVHKNGEQVTTDKMTKVTQVWEEASVPRECEMNVS